MTPLNRIAAALLFAIVASASAGCITDALANSQANQRYVSCGGSASPFYGRTDGICFDKVLQAPGTIVNGSFDHMLSTSLYTTVAEDFLGSRTVATSADTDGGPWFGYQTNQAAGPALVDDAADGVFQLALDNGSEVGNMDLDWGDTQSISSDKEPFCTFRVQIPSTPTSADTIAWGLSDGHNALVDSTTHNAYLGTTGANLNLAVWSDDNVTDTNASASGITLTAATWAEFMISLNSMHGASSTNVKYFYRSSLGGDWTALLPTTTFKIGAGNSLQPFVHVEKTTGTTTPSVKVDYIKCSWKRT